MARNGWIKLHRKLLEKGYWDKSQYVHLWLHLLLTANHQPNEYMTNGRIILIKEGQLVTGRKQLSLATGIPESTVEDILKLFENEQQIQQQKTTKYRLITILNWKDYQESDNKATTKQQQADTIKNDKKEKNNTSANAETYLPSDWHIEEDTAKPKRTEPLAKPHEFIEIWNRYSDWKKLGIKDTPANPSVKEKLLPEAKSTTSLNGALVKARNKLSAQEFEKAVKNYVTELVNRKKDEKGYYQHRYTLYMFVVHKNVLENYVNR